VRQGVRREHWVLSLKLEDRALSRVGAEALSTLLGGNLGCSPLRLGLNGAGTQDAQRNKGTEGGEGERLTMGLCSTMGLRMFQCPPSAAANMARASSSGRPRLARLAPLRLGQHDHAHAGRGPSPPPSAGPPPRHNQPREDPDLKGKA